MIGTAATQPTEVVSIVLVGLWPLEFRDVCHVGRAVQAGPSSEIETWTRRACNSFCDPSCFASLVTIQKLPAQSPDTIQVYSSPASQANAQAVEKFTLTGMVVDSVTGEPIRKALVQVYAGQRRMTFSGDDGSFELEGIPAGSYSVSAQKPGYFSEQELLRGGAPPVEVGVKAGSAIVKLTPEAVLSGKVTSITGVPLEHVSLRLNYIEIREGRRRWDFKGIGNHRRRRTLPLR